MPPTLTFVPGTMCDRRIWEPVWRELNGRFPVGYIPIETTFTHDGMIGLFDTAASVGRKLNLVAFSMGGYLALQYTLDHPDRVASLAVIGTSAFGLSEKEKAERGRALKYLATHEYRGIPPSRINPFVHPSHQSDPGVVDVIRAMDRDLGKEVLMAQLRETTTRESLEPRLRELDCPVLLVGSDSDPYLSPADIERMHALIPHSRRELAREAGHMLPLEQPAWLAARIAGLHPAGN
ncbi:MAG: alpha/beta hydrolase [Hyphomonadaceae bacterium]|nr:alpha/beta hydrolase [Hyphomonadaceae bacterium]